MNVEITKKEIVVTLTMTGEQAITLKELTGNIARAQWLDLMKETECNKEDTARLMEQLYYTLHKVI